MTSTHVNIDIDVHSFVAVSRGRLQFWIRLDEALKLRNTLDEILRRPEVKEQLGDGVGR